MTETASFPAMPRVYGFDQLFAFSGMEGPTRVWKSLVGSTLGGRFGLWLHSNRNRLDESGIHVFICAEKNGSRAVRIRDFHEVTYDFVLGDALQARLKLDDSLWEVLFLPLRCDRIGVSVTRLAGDAEMQIVVEEHFLQADRSEAGGLTTIRHQDEFFQVLTREKAVTDGVRAVLAWSEGTPLTRDALARDLKEDWEPILERRLKWIADLPLPGHLPVELIPFYRRLASGLRVNAMSPEGAMTVPWVTPNRWPHRLCHLWDSGFQAVGYVRLDPEWGRNALRGAWCQQMEDGFLRHIGNPDGTENHRETGSAVLAWHSWEVAEFGRNRSFLAEAYPPLCRYLECCLSQRRPEYGDLISWPRFGHGMGNSPRFDDGQPEVLVDANLYVANDLRFLEKMAHQLEKPEEETRWRVERETLARAINTYLWDDLDGLYYDRRADGTRVRAKTPISFVAILADICNPRQRTLLLRRLLDPSSFWSETPVPSVALNDPTHEKDMWRGPMWPNISYMVYRSLLRAGKSERADQLARLVVERTLEWYERLGGVFEFYDAENQVSPMDIKRKRGMGAVNDYGWGHSVSVALLWHLYNDPPGDV